MLGSSEAGWWMMAGSGIEDVINANGTVVGLPRSGPVLLALPFPSFPSM